MFRLRQPLILLHLVATEVFVGQGRVRTLGAGGFQEFVVV
jgi:hypothetical protein